ncbi:MAG TPA: metal ABC transporter permease [Acidimicrobiales bacterium]|jgi:zinc/manganese transport system permease protein|nr:metal ABC transporter permease [Acidimicrobiales bacterium]
MNVIRDLFEFQFMVNAFRAGSVVAVLAGTVGWFMVLRRQTFAGHTLALIGFPGAAGAVLLGLSPQLGFFAFCIGGALVIAAVPAHRPGSFSEESAVIAIVQTFALACGFLFASLYRGNLSRINGLLFGTFLGITTTQVHVLVVVTAAALGVLAVVARPLLFASVDPDAAGAAGVPTRVLAVVFLVLLGVAAAEASQITGSLLIFTLLVLPAATAQAITSRPGAGLALSVGVALVVTWIGLGIAYYSPYPIGFWISSIAFGLYVVARSAQLVRWT